VLPQMAGAAAVSRTSVVRLVIRFDAAS